MAKRGFEIVSSYQDQGIHLPQRQTTSAAGYDIEAAERVVLPSFWSADVKAAGGQGKGDLAKITQPSLVPTGLKAYMPHDEYLQIISRSSNPWKRNLTLPNGVGIIDSDYYNNANNEGHIYVQLLNFGLEDVVIEKGERIAQGIFTPYLKTDQDSGGLKERSGGFGSSGQ